MIFSSPVLRRLIYDFWTMAGHRATACGTVNPGVTSALLGAAIQLVSPAGVPPGELHHFVRVLRSTTHSGSVIALGSGISAHG
jgi:hypothetical protein